ncbi:MAG TPA: transcriptional regulator [Anaerolineales bacterium]|nr:transcriptional regulator [Anaerolineales bacterium]
MSEKPGHSIPQPHELRAIEELDPAIHAPARLMILAFLAAVDAADFTFLLNQTGLTRGNLANHIGRLEEAGYVAVNKTFVERIPQTTYRLTDAGREAIEKYRVNMRQVIDSLLE